MFGLLRKERTVCSELRAKGRSIPPLSSLQPGNQRINKKIQTSPYQNFQDPWYGFGWPLVWFTAQQPTRTSLSKLAEHLGYQGDKVDNRERAKGVSKRVYWFEWIFSLSKKMHTNAENSNLLEYSSLLQLWWQFRNNCEIRPFWTQGRRRRISLFVKLGRWFSP